MSNRLFAINILLRTCPLMIDLEYAMVYCLLANAISGAKLVKMFEEAKFRCVKVQFFSGAVV